MTAFNELTQEEKEKIAQGERWLRGVMSSLVGFADEADFNLKAQYWADEIQPIIDTLDAGEVIPNTSGLAGATGVPHESMTAAKEWLFGIQGDIDTYLPLVVKLIGINSG